MDHLCNDRDFPDHRVLDHAPLVLVLWEDHGHQDQVGRGGRWDLNVSLVHREDHRDLEVAHHVVQADLLVHRV